MSFYAPIAKEPAIRYFVNRAGKRHNHASWLQQILQRFIIAPWAKKDDKIKLNPVRGDRSALEKLFGPAEDYERGSNLTINYQFFYDQILKEEVTIDELYDAIGNSWGYTNYLDEAATVECMELQTLGTYNQRWNEAGTTSGHCESTGSIFGAAPGQGRYVVANSCWQVDKGTFYSNIDSSQDHVYDFTNVGPGTYRILFTKMEGKSSYYNLYLTYDGGAQAIAIPDDSILSTAEWTESPDIVVSESIQQINAQWISRSAPKDKCIPAIQLIRVIPPSQAVYAKEGEFRLPNAENWAMWPTNQPPAGKLNFIIKY